MMWGSKYQNNYTDRLKAALAGTGLSNIFNPSPLYLGNRLFIAFRAIDKVLHRGIQSYLVIFTESFERLSLINLSIHGQQRGISSIADPKLFLGHDQTVWVTFNTGYSKTQNEIYVMQVFPALGVPRKCIYPTRKKVEKNWAFFFEGSKLFALYALNPTVILKADEVTGNEIIFSLHQDTSASTDLELSIGTQLISLRDGRFGLIAHRKISIFGKRLYYGVPVMLSKTAQGYRVDMANLKMAHSFIALFGARKKHNKNLISCTYFSGVCTHGDKLVLGYGINDVDCSFASLKITDLWK